MKAQPALRRQTPIWTRRELRRGQTDQRISCQPRHIRPIEARFELRQQARTDRFMFWISAQVLQLSLIHI